MTDDKVISIMQKLRRKGHNMHPVTLYDDMEMRWQCVVCGYIYHFTKDHPSCDIKCTRKVVKSWTPHLLS